MLLAGVAYPAIVLSAYKEILGANTGLRRLAGLEIKPDAAGTIIGTSIEKLQWTMVPIKSPAYRTWDALVEELLERASTPHSADRMTDWLLDQEADDTESYRISRDANATEEFWNEEDRIRMAEELHVYIPAVGPRTGKKNRLPPTIKTRMRMYPVEFKGDTVFILTFRRPRPLPSTRSDSVTVLPPEVRTPWAGIKDLDPKLIGDVDDVHSVISKLIPHVLGVMDADGQVEYLSPSWYNFTGLSEEHSLGSGWADTIHGDDLPDMVKEYAALIKEQRTHWTWEARYRRYDGEYKYFLVHAYPLRDSSGKVLKWFASMLDVNDLVLARVESDRRKQSILTVVSQSDVSLWSVNQAYEVILLEGTLEWDPHGLSKHLKTSGQKLDIAEIIKKVLSGESLMEIVEHQNNDHWYRTRFVADIKHDTVDDDGERVVEAALGLTIDITDVKARAMLQVENERLIANEHAAMEASKLKSRFLANVGARVAFSSLTTDRG